MKSASAGEITSHTAAVDGTKGPETKGAVSTSDDDKKLVELKKGRLGKMSMVATKYAVTNLQSNFCLEI